MKKELLTVENVKKDLGGAMMRYILFLAGASIFCAVIALMGYLEYGLTPITQITVGLLVLVVIYGVCFILKIKKKADGDFVIVTDVLCEKYVESLGRYESTVDSYHLKFSECGEYEIPNASYRWKKKVSAEKLYSTCTEGDEFYLIMENGKKSEILAVYNKKYFELSGELSARVTEQ